MRVTTWSWVPVANVQVAHIEVVLIDEPLIHCSKQQIDMRGGKEIQKLKMANQADIPRERILTPYRFRSFTYILYLSESFCLILLLFVM